MAQNNLLDLEVESDDQCLLDNIEYFSKFLADLKIKEKEGLSKNSELILKKFKNSLLEYAEDGGDLKNQNDLISSPGAIDFSGFLAEERFSQKSKGQGAVFKHSTPSNVNVAGDRVIKQNNNLLKSSDESSDSSVVSSPVRSRRHENTNQSAAFGMEDIFRRFDSRKVPELEKYNESTGDLCKFLEKFEEYCLANFRGSEDFWPAELEKLLSGSILDYFRCMRQIDDNYRELKAKMLSWFKDNAKSRKRDNVNRFENAKLKPDETLHTYSIRLEALFRKAHPNRSVEDSKRLMKQFKSTIPTKSKDFISTQVFNLEMKDIKPTWSFIKKCVKVKQQVDVETGDNCNQETSEAVMINLSKQKYFASRNFTRSPKKRITSNSRTRGDFQANTVTCFACNRIGHKANQCRQNLRSCYACGQRGHFIRDCRKKNDFWRNAKTERRPSPDDRSSRSKDRIDFNGRRSPKRRGNLSRSKYPNPRFNIENHKFGNNFENRSISQNNCSRRDYDREENRFMYRRTYENPNLLDARAPAYHPDNSNRVGSLQENLISKSPGRDLN